MSQRPPALQPSLGLPYFMSTLSRRGQAPAAHGRQVNVSRAQALRAGALPLTRPATRSGQHAATPPSSAALPRVHTPHVMPSWQTLELSRELEREQHTSTFVYTRHEMYCI